MSDAAPAPAEEPAKRKKRRRARSKVDGLARQMLEGLWDDGFGGADELYSRLRGYSDGGPGWLPLTVPSDRRHGANWPLWRTELELDRLRQQARVLCQSNAYAEGLTWNVVNYVGGDGCAYRAAHRKMIDGKPLKPGQPIPPDLARVVADAQVVLDEFLALNNWNGSATGATGGPLLVGNSGERECILRVTRDGEAFLRFFGDDEGRTYVRFVGPEIVRNPPGGIYTEGWTYGIRHRMEPFEDVQFPEEYHLAWRDSTTGSKETEQDRSSNGEHVPAEEMLHLKGPFTDSDVKRGTPPFSFDVREAFERASKLQRNISISAAIRAATAEIWQNKLSTGAQVSSLVGNLQTFQRTDPQTGQTETFERIKPGTIRRVGGNQELVSHPEDQTASYVQGVNADLRQAATAFGAPEYLATGDSSNSNYASTKEAGAPWAQSAKALQGYYKAGFLRVAWWALRWAVECGKLDPRALRWVELQVEPPPVVYRDELQRAQTDQILIQAKVKSPQTAQMERGLDPEEQDANFQQSDAKGQQGQGGGAPQGGGPEQEQQPQGGADGGDQSGGADPLASVMAAAGQQQESLREALEQLSEIRREIDAAKTVAPAKGKPDCGCADKRASSEALLLEGAGKNATGEFKNKNGRRYCLRNGRPTPCAKLTPAERGELGPGEVKPGEQPRPPVTPASLHDEIEALRANREKLGPEKYHTGLQALAAQMAGMKLTDLRDLAKRLEAGVKDRSKVGLAAKIADHVRGLAPVPSKEPEQPPEAKAPTADEVSAMRKELAEDEAWLAKKQGQPVPTMGALEQRLQVEANVKRLRAKLAEIDKSADGATTPPEPGFTGIDANGHKWVDGKQVAIGDEGEAHEPGGEGSDGAGSERPAGVAPGDGGPVEGEAARSADTGADQGGNDTGEPAGAATAERVPASIGEVNKRLDRFQKFFEKKGQGHVADWLGKLKEHVNAVGGEAALQALGAPAAGGPTSDQKVQYWGVGTEEANWKSMGAFMEAYLARNGIVAITGEHSYRGMPLISALGKPDVYLAGDFKPERDAFKDKLDEAKHLPGLEKSEDVARLMGHPVTHLTDDVIGKLNATYGEGKWIVKCYSDEAAAGYGIFFPQRAAAIVLDARNTVSAANEALSRFGFRVGRNPNTGKVFGIVHESGDIYQFGTPEYEQTIHGESREWAERARAVADSEHGAILPPGKFMAQPAFPAVGISDAERAAGKTWHEKNEGRVHLVTRHDGKVEVVPHSTWLKGGNLPVVFEDDDTRAMAKAAQDTINQLPEAARRGQVYAPDVMKTADGYKVVELNAQGDHNGSGYLHDNQFTIDAYVSHLTKRDPAHVQFIRQLLTQKEGRRGKPQEVAPEPDRGSGAEGGGDRAEAGGRDDAGTAPGGDRPQREGSGSVQQAAETFAKAGVGSLPVGTVSWERWRQPPEVQQAYNDQVMKAAHEGGLFIEPHNLPAAINTTPNVGGNEHDVHQDAEANTYYKLTKGGHYGYNKDLPEYLERHRIANELWPSLGYRVHGVTRDFEGRPQVVMAMNRISGSHPEQHEIEDWFRSRGWQPAEGQHEPEKGVRNWVDPTTGTHVLDAHPGNFMKNEGGLVPIDVDILPGKSHAQEGLSPRTQPNTIPLTESAAHRGRGERWRGPSGHEYWRNPVTGHVELAPVEKTVNASMAPEAAVASPTASPAAGPPKVGDRVRVRGGVGDVADYEVEVKTVAGGRVGIGEPHHPFAVKEVPLTEWPEFADDLRGMVRLPPDSGNGAVDAVAAGRAQFLGKGDDGLVFRVGDRVVKTSTVVPLIPTNPSGRTGASAAESLLQQSLVSEDMRAAGVPGVLPVQFVAHGGKGLQVRPYVEVPERLTAEELSLVRGMLEEMHRRGFSLNDDVQVGILDGRPVFFDTGKAARLPADPRRARDAAALDLTRLEYLFRKNGASPSGEAISDGPPLASAALHKTVDSWLDASTPHWQFNDLPGQPAGERIAQRRAAIRSAFLTACERLGPRAVARALANAKTIVFHQSIAFLTTAAKNQGLEVRHGQQVGGLWVQEANEDKGTLHLDGGDDTGANYGDLAMHLHAHELGHAIDAGRVLSSKAEWMDAWKAEIDQPGDPLTKYARKSPAEGLGELARAMVVDPAAARAKLPLCHAFWEKEGLL